MYNAIKGKALLQHHIIRLLETLPPGEYRDAVQVYDSPDIKPHAKDVNDVSTKLSDMWRSTKIPVVRVPTRRPGSPVQYAYAVSAEPKVMSVVVPKKTEAKPTTTPVKVQRTDMLLASNQLDTRPEVTITDTYIKVVSSKFKLTIELT